MKWTLTIFAFCVRSQASYCLLLVWCWWWWRWRWGSYLSEDEAGGRGAAIGPLQPAASGVRPSISLQMKQNIHLCSMWFCCTSHCVSSSHRRTEGRPPCCSLIITRVSVTRALTLSTPLLSLSPWPDYIKSVFWHFIMTPCTPQNNTDAFLWPIFISCPFIFSVCGAQIPEMKPNTSLTSLQKCKILTVK